VGDTSLTQHAEALGFRGDGDQLGARARAAGHGQRGALELGVRAPLRGERQIGNQQARAARSIDVRHPTTRLA